MGVALLYSKVPKRVSLILLCTSGAATLMGRRLQQQGRETITLLLMEWLSESERYLGGVHRQSNNSVLCIVSSHAAFQMAGCGYASFHFSAEPLLMWITSLPLPPPRVEAAPGGHDTNNNLTFPERKILFFSPLEVHLFCSILFRHPFILSPFLVSKDSFCRINTA